MIDLTQTLDALLQGKDLGEAQASDRDELRYYTALTNVTPDRQLRFALGATYYDRRGEGPFLEDSDEFDFYEWWVSVQFLEFLFQPDLQVYYDHPASGSGPEDGVYAGLTLRQPLPLGRFGGFIGLSQLNLSSTFWYQDGVFGYEPGSSLEASIEAPMTLWGLEVRPGVGVSQLFDEPEGSRISDDREDWWYSIAVTYRFGRPYVEPRAPGPFDVSAE